MSEICYKGIRVKFTNECTTIYECYKVKKVKEFVMYVMNKRYELGYKLNRSIDSYIKELKAHIRLYKLGIARSHTIDADLEENLTKDKGFIWQIIGR
jgi:hypothetical protein